MSLRGRLLLHLRGPASNPLELLLFVVLLDYGGGGGSVAGHGRGDLGGPGGGEAALLPSQLLTLKDAQVKIQWTEEHNHGLRKEREVVVDGWFRALD